MQYRSFQDRHYETAYDLVLMAVSFVFINSFSEFFFYQKLMLKIDCTVSTRCYGKYTKYVNFLWPLVVAAYDHTGLAQALSSSRSYSSKKNYPYTQDSVMFMGLCGS